MADISVTATAVVKSTGANSNAVIWGETVTAGMCVYLAADGKWYKAVTTSGGTAIQAGSLGLGIAQTGGAANQPGFVQTTGDLTIGATIAVGVFYYVSQTAAGGFSLPADLGTGDYSSIIGYGKTTAVMTVLPIATGLTLA